MLKHIAAEGFLLRQGQSQQRKEIWKEHLQLTFICRHKLTTNKAYPLSSNCSAAPGIGFKIARPLGPRAVHAPNIPNMNPISINVMRLLKALPSMYAWNARVLHPCRTTNYLTRSMSALDMVVPFMMDCVRDQDLSFVRCCTLYKTLDSQI